MECLGFLFIFNNPSLNDTDFLHEDRFHPGTINIGNCGFTKLFIPMNVRTIFAGGNKINEITAHPNSTLDTLFIERNNFTNLSQLSPIVNLEYLSIGYNGIDHFDFSHFAHMKKLRGLFIELNPKQNISAAGIKKILPSLWQFEIESPDLNAEKRKQIFNDFKQHGLDIKINGKQYREITSQKSKILQCLGRMD